MCGLTFILAGKPGAVPDEAQLRRMSELLRHRGPDQEAVERDEAVGMVHRRLAVIDLAGGRQPIRALGGRVRMVYNGEIYNFKEIARELEGTRWEFSPTSDSEVLLAAYLEWGRDCLRRLNGMFAFVIHDARDDSVFAARDRFGEKPLYVADGGDWVAFTSELKTLLATGLLRPSIDPVALYDYLTRGYVRGPGSIFRNVSRVGPGEWLRWEEGRMTRGTYWDLPGSPDEEPMSQAEAVDRTLAALTRSVERRLVSDVPVGFFLSGGVDSSLVVATAAGVLDRGMETFAVGFDVPEYDERPYARAVAERFGTRHHEFLLEPKGIEVLDRLAWHLDEPFADNSALPTFFLSEMTRARVTVALSGDGGDELFAGYDVYKGHVVSERVRRVPRPLMSMAGVAAGALAASDSPRRERWDRLGRNLRDARLPWLERYRLKQQAVVRSDFLGEHLLLPDVVRLGVARERAFLEELASAAPSPLHAMATHQRKVSLVDDMLVKVDRMSMAHSLEVRPPFLDHELAELAWRIPFSVKMPGTRTKEVLKVALERYMPRDFVRRSKRGFSTPLNHWFRDDLHDMAAVRLLDTGSFVGRVMSRAGLETLLGESRRAGRRGTALWALLMLDAWARVHDITGEALPPA